MRSFHAPYWYEMSLEAALAGRTTAKGYLREFHPGATGNLKTGVSTYFILRVAGNEMRARVRARRLTRTCQVRGAQADRADRCCSASFRRCARMSQ